MQVLQDVASFVNAFAELFVTETIAAHATLQGLVTLRKAQPEVYKIVSLQMKAKSAEGQWVSLTVPAAPCAIHASYQLYMLWTTGSSQC